eukprot:NODE_106_length_19857_cov_0.799980.p8 type:complete len:296 gc:universal NODE_106_length_19857_cov_0.799980:11163-12050(+)
MSMTLTSNEEISFYTGLFAAVLSLIGTTVVLAVSIYVEPTSNTRTNLVVSLMTAQWLRAFTVVSGSIIRITMNFADFSPGLGCSLNGFFIEQTLVAGDIANLSIGIFTWLAFAKKKTFARAHKFLDKHLTSIFLFPWLIGGVLATGAFFYVGYSPVKSNWCFISASNNNLGRWIFAWSHRIFFSVVLFILYGHILKIVVKSRRVLEETSAADRSHSKRLNKAARKLFLYPVVYVLWGLPGILSRVITSPTLEMLQMASQSVGFVDALLYGYSEDLRRRFFDKLRPDKQYKNDFKI